MIGGSGGNVIRALGPPEDTPDKELPPEVLLLRKLRPALGVGERDPITVLKGQRSFDGKEVGE